uniref:CBM96 family carbohydrate-binding protein n=1 Tax=Flammeovirga yaeyamensis TaxID=367791 RepID=UPI00374259E8
MSFTESAGSVNIAVTTSETFSVSDNQSWITASKSGDNVVINVTENTGSTERSGTVTVSGCETKTISVTQSGTATTCSLSVSSSSLSFSDAAGNNTVNVTSTESFTASSSQSWISTSISGNVITVSVSANSSSSARNGSVVVNGCQSKTISVAQSAGSSSGGGSTITVTDDAYVREDKPNNNYGSATSVRTEKISSEDQEGYLKFNLSGLSSSSINVAKLRVYPYSGRGVNNSLHVGNSNSWSESNITWSNKPSYGSTIATWYINDDDQYFYIDITSQVKSNAGGNLTLVITGASQDDIRYRSKESGNNAAVILINDDASNTRQLNSSISLNGDLEEELMNIYPNPISSSILKIVGTVEPILIFNIQGEKLIETTSKSIDVSELSPGFYIVRSGNQVKKLIKK